MPERETPAGQSACLRVCFVSVNAIRILLGHSEGFGGAEVELVNVATQLAADNAVQVSLVTVSDTLNGPSVMRGISVLPVRPTPSAISSAGLLSRRAMVLSYYLRFMRTLRACRADLYFSKLASDEAILTFLTARLRRRPFLFRIEHDWETVPSDLRQNLFHGSAARTRLFTYCLKRADRVICQTRKQQRALLEHYGVRADLVNNAHQLPSSQEIGPEGRELVLWIARAHPMKRPKLYLELASRLPDQRFTIVMAPDPAQASLSTEVEQLAAQLPNVTYVPGLPQSQVAPLYRRARVFVLTSDAEGFANTVIEALKWGTPVVSLLLDFDGMLRGIGPAGADDSAPGFCAQGDFERLVDQTRRLCSDDEYWTASSRKAREYALEHFDVEAIASNYVRMMKEEVGAR